MVVEFPNLRHVSGSNPGAEMAFIISSGVASRWMLWITPLQELSGEIPYDETSKVPLPNVSFLILLSAVAVSGEGVLTMRMF